MFDLMLRRVLITLSFVLISISANATTSIYGVVPPLFGERPLVSVTERLGRLSDLGVDVLWIAPVMVTDDPSFISYAITDFTKIRNDFGTDEDLRVLVREAHARKMKVILDFVPNHTSMGHAWFTTDRNSIEWSLHQRDADGNHVHYFDWKHLPNLNYDDSRVPDAMIAAMEFWMREFDVDGFRYDAAWGVQERASWFWPKALAKLRSKFPHMIALAEAGGRDPSYRRAGFDFTYDWTRNLGEWSWKKAFEDQSKLSSHLRDALTGDARDQELIVRFLNNNDTGERFVSRHGLAFTEVATVLTYTVPGTPLLFTGDECAAEYEPYDDSSKITWNDSHPLVSLHRKLASLRTNHSSLVGGRMQILPLTRNERVFSFVRRKGSDITWVILNFGPTAKVELQLPSSDLANRRWKDALHSRRLETRHLGDGRVQITLPTTSAFVLIPR